MILPQRRRQLEDMARALLSSRDERRRARQVIAGWGSSTLTDRLPWLPYAFIEHFDGQLQGASIFEYGGGGSTLWFLDQGAKVVTVEHNEEWASQLRSTVGETAAWSLREVDISSNPEDYISAVDAEPDASFDLIVVDGRHRVRCASRAITKVKAGGRLVLDDVDRDKYGPVFTDLSSWEYEVFCGFAPHKRRLAYSGCWRRPAHE